VCTRRAAYVHLTHSLAVRPVSAAMRGLTPSHPTPQTRTTNTQGAGGRTMGGSGVGGGGSGVAQHKHECKL